jgi:PBSX family phage terminase large subunit
MDTDGYVDDRGHMSYSTISYQLAEDVAFVIRSLGGIATIKKNPAGYKNKNKEFIKCNDVYDVYIRTKFDPELVRLSRKKQRCRYEFNGGNSELGKRIVDIEFIGRKKGRCITVDEPCGLYIADNFTVTHNSYLGSCWVISSCMRFENIRAVVARKTIKSLKESTFNTIRTVLKAWGLKEGVNYKINNLEGIVTFWNDSVILLKEMVDLPSDLNFERFGSSEYTIAFIDEVSEISERAVEVLFSRLRWRTHETFKTPRMLMSTNPCVTWVRSRFVQDDDGNPVSCREGEAYVPFSIFDNPDIKFKQTYEASLNKISDKATKERLLYGNWDFVDTNEMAAYWKFDGDKHLVTGLKEKVYNPLKPLINSWDFNVSPFMSTLSLQIDYDLKKIYVLEEVLGKPEEKENNTPKLAAKIRKKYLTEKHVGGLLITGDPAGLARSTQTEEGVNNYTIILSNVDNPVLRAQKKLLTKQPSQITRLDFINSLFEGYDGWEILIDMRCRRFVEDLIYQKKNADGTKCKSKVTDPKTGIKYEKYGHLSDCFDYAVCLFVSDLWNKFQRKNSTIETTVTPIYGTFSY